MENSKRFHAKAFIGSTSSRQRLRRQEGIPCDVPIALGNRADSVRPLASFSSIVHRQLPCHQGRRADNDDLLASIDRHG